MRKIVRIGVLLIAAFFFGVSLYSIVIDKDFAAGIMCFIPTASFIGLYLYLHSLLEDPFFQWLSGNANKVVGQGANYRDRLIHRDLEVVQFEGCVSFLVISFKFRSPILLPGDKITETMILYSLVTLLGGWWGLPYGIYWTFQTLYHNLRGGIKSRVGSFITH